MIKRFLTLMLISTAFVTAVLAGEVFTISPDHSFHLLPAAISNDGKAFVYDYSYEINNTTRFYVYDDDFQLVKEFVTLPGTPNAYSYEIQERESIPINAIVYDEYREGEALIIDGKSEGLDIETVLNALNQYNHLNSNWEIYTMEDGTQVVANTSEYYKEEYFGKQYPRFVYKLVDGLWYYYRIEYNTLYGPYGEWQEAKNYQGDGSYPSLIDIEIVPVDGSDEQWYELTRGIFSDDCCYLLPEYCKVEYYKEYTYENTEWVYKKEWGYRYQIKSYKAFDSSNNIVASFDVPEGYNGTTDVTFMMLNDKRYILIEIIKPATPYDEELTAIYRLDEDNKVTQVAIAPSTKVSPRTPRQGELVTVTFNESYITYPKTINVVSASGQTVYKTKLPAGQSSINLDTSRLNQGMYIVTITANGENSEAAKIIVR